jgi:hypothetical protein
LFYLPRFPQGRTISASLEKGQEEKGLEIDWKDCYLMNPGEPAQLPSRLIELRFSRSHMETTGIEQKAGEFICSEEKVKEYKSNGKRNRTRIK